MEKRSPQDAANVFVTVLFPEVPTGAPTGVAVPIEITVTGTLNAADVPTGFQVPTDAATAPPATATATPSPTDTPTTQPTTAAKTETTPTSQTTQTTESTQSTTSTDTTSTQSTLSTTTRPTTSASRTTGSSSTSGTAINASTSASAQPTAIGNSHHDTLSAGAIAGIVIGVVAFVAALAIMFLFLMRPSKKKAQRNSSPGVYPEEAYLYDPPMSGANTPGGGMAMKNVDADTRSIRAQSFGRPGTPNMAETERQGLLAGAAAGGGALGAGAAARSRRGTMSGNASPALRPAGGNGYAPVDTRDITEMSAGNPFADQETEYNRGGNAPVGGAAWPMNPRAPSGLGTPPASRGGPAEAMERLDPVESRSQTPGSMYRDNPGPSSNAMREARRAWGMD